jgi:hypothetical protein
MAAGAALAGCGAQAAAEDFTWSIDCPKTVDKGAEFRFTVRSAIDAGPVEGVSYRYQILWPGGSSHPLPHKGRTGEAEKLHARQAAGPASIVVTCSNRAGQETKVLEFAFEVKE